MPTYENNAGNYVGQDEVSLDGRPSSQTGSSDHNNNNQQTGSEFARRMQVPQQDQTTRTLWTRKKNFWYN